ncbi:gliding motility-associated C-terminal domain-containing protein [Pustulibacterium marinum]|uniref:Gliding motility-associated C-terminal domain-containing protein n=1 Tax=Pustulibacterium marinum TaxID=1224947 RepID=A0A1I7HJE4_9FLAO|nr:PKD domain-containing protein [Pustulibacterium marinum]SFU60699.1 gliding motility-associated C-terminal domain-containing protein [Pustulibacterium marinum]
MKKLYRLLILALLILGTTHVASILIPTVVLTNIHATNAFYNTPIPENIFTQLEDDLEVSIAPVSQNECAGTNLNFSATVTGGTAPYTYEWNFGDGNTANTQNTTHAFNPSFGCGTPSYTVTVTITDADDTTVSTTTSVSVLQKPHVDIEDVDVPYDPFRNCDNNPTLNNPDYTITVGNISNSSSCTSSYTLSWGDGSANVTNLSMSDFPLTHTYTALGAYNLTLTAHATNGCDNSVTYVVANQTNPAGSLGTLGSTTGLCAPATVPFTIGNWELNSPGTEYILDFGDGESTTLTHPLNDTNTTHTIEHNYSTSSCPNQTFTAILTVTNACDGTPYTAGNIQIRIQPEAEFTALEYGCAGNSITFINTTEGGYVGSSCSTYADYEWDFGDPASGDANTYSSSGPTAPNANHTFTSAGTYTVTLTTTNSCGTSSYSKDICIDDGVPTSSFTLNNTEGCETLSVQATNTTANANSCHTEYSWSVAYTQDNCGTPPPSNTNYFANGSSNTDEHPEFYFPNPGTYEITLTSENSCGTHQASQTVQVKNPPEVTIDAIADVCGGTEATITPTATVTNCGNDEVSYLWTFTGGTPSSAITATPTDILYSLPGEYTVTLAVTNECGTTTATQNFTVAPEVLADAGTDTTICEGATTTLNGSGAGGTGANYTYSWSPATGLSNTAIATPTASPTETTTYTLTVANGNCSGSSEVTVYVNAFDVGTLSDAQVLCEGDTPETITELASPTSDGAISYQWQLSTDNNTYTDITGATNATYTPDNITQTTWYQRTVTSEVNGISCTVSNPPVSITLNTLTPGVITADQTICSGGTPETLSAATATVATGTLLYQWESSTDNTIFTPIAGATNASYTPTALSNATWFRRIDYSSLNGTSCSAMTNTIAITLTNAPTITETPIASQILCEGDIPETLTVATDATDTTYFQWYSNTTNTNTNGTPISGATTASYNPPTTTAGIVYYYCVVSTDGAGCDTNSATATINVIGAPTITTQPMAETLCEGVAPSSLSVSYQGGTGTPTLQWYENTADDTSNGTPISGATNTTYTPPATLGTVYYYAVITFPSQGCNVLTSVTAAVTIQQLPVISSGTTITVCSNESFTYTPDTSNNTVPENTQYTWNMPTGTGFTGATAENTPTDNFSQQLVNTTANTVTALYTVTPVANGCTGNPFDVTVTIHPKANIPDTAIEICNNQAFSFDPATVATLLPDNTVYSWAIPEGNVSGGAAGNNASVISGNLTNATTNVVTTVYTVTPTSPQGACVGAPFTLSVQVHPSFSVSSTTSEYNGYEISTAGGNDGFINLTPTGGTGNYTYNWTGPDGYTATTQNGTNLVAGTYTVTISDGLCDPIILIIEMHEPLPLVIEEVLAAHVDVDCYGDTTGVISISITQASISPYTYAIYIEGVTLVESSAETPNENYTFENLAAGNYTVSVTDANGTVKYLNNLEITEPDNPILVTATLSDFNGFNTSCYGAQDAAISTSVSGGYPPYNFSWTGPDGFTANTQNVANLTPGIYEITVTDSTNACAFTAAYTITEPDTVTLTATVTDYNGYEIACQGGDSGAISLTMSGGTGYYTYSWTGPDGFTATTASVTGLTEGSYAVTVTDTNGCSTADNFTLSEPTGLSITESHIDVICFGDATGSIDATVTGGTPDTNGNYSYFWTGPNGFTATTEDLSNIVAGTYEVIATDANGCTINISATLTQEPEIIITPTTTPISCYGANDASLSLEVSGGNPPYAIVWANFAEGTYQDNLAAGNYTITVTDASNCVQSITVPIPEAPEFAIYPEVAQISCNGADDGSIALNLVGGINPVTLEWSDGDDSGTTRNNLTAGTYTVTITDGTPCVIIETFVISEPAPLVLSGNVTDALDCDEPASGNINLLVNGGMPPYVFNWSNGATTEDLTNIPNGNYSVVVTDANGCTANASFTITRPDPLHLDITDNEMVDCDAHTVVHQYTANAIGGIPPYTYSWSSGTVSGANNENMTTSVSNGTIIVTVTDGYGCTITETFESTVNALGDAYFEPYSLSYGSHQEYSIYDPITFDNLSEGDYFVVSWNFGDGNYSSSVNPVHTYTTPGTYTVTLVVNYDYGCQETYEITITVTEGYRVMIPNSFTPNNDGINDYFTPTYKGIGSIELKIYDTWGNLVYLEKGETIQGWNGLRNGYEAENGNYHYRITGESFYGATFNYQGAFTLLK